MKLGSVQLAQDKCDEFRRDLVSRLDFDSQEVGHDDDPVVQGPDGSTEGHRRQWLLNHDPEAVMVKFADLGDPVPAAMEVELILTSLAHPGADLVGHFNLGGGLWAVAAGDAAAHCAGGTGLGAASAL